MSATKLRELVKTHFTSLHRKLLEKGSGKRVQQNSAHLIVCIFYTLQVELNYFDDVNREDLINIWKSVMDAKAAEKSLIYQLANVIFSASSASAGEVLIHGLDDLLSLNDHENGREQDLLHDYSYIVTLEYIF